MWVMEISSVVFVIDVPSSSAYCLPPSPEQSCLCFETGQHSGSWCLPFAPALLELMSGAALCAQFECYGSLVLLGSSRSPITPPFLNSRALFIGLLSLAWHYLQLDLSPCLLAVTILWPFLSTPSPCAPAVSVPNSPPPSTEHFLQSLSRFQTHLLHMPSLHPMPAQSIFYVSVNQVGLFHKMLLPCMLPLLGRGPGRLWALTALCGQWNLPEPSPSGPCLAVLGFMGKIESWDLRFKYFFKDFSLFAMLNFW